MPAGKTSKKAKKDLFSPKNIKKVDKKLLSAAIAKDRNPYGVSKKTKRKTDKDVQQMKKGSAKFFGNVLRSNAEARKNMKKNKKPSLKKMKEAIRK
jgi:hypothetical protein